MRVTATARVTVAVTERDRVTVTVVVTERDRSTVIMTVTLCVCVYGRSCRLCVRWAMQCSAAIMHSDMLHSDMLHSDVQ